MNSLEEIAVPTSSPQLVEVLFGAYRRRILSLLLLHPHQSYYLREIARLTGVPAGSLHRELKLLQDAGLLARSTAGNQVRYQANPACPIFEELAGVFRKTARLADILREALAPLGAAVRLAFVFGAIAQGDEHMHSRVDVMVLGSAGFAQVLEALAPATGRLHRDINPVVMTVSAFGAKLAARDHFVTRIAHEPKIFLVGGATELAKLAEHQAA